MNHDGSIHSFFGLTYSNYLVLHRTLMQSMPEEWQAKFVKLIEEMESAYSHLVFPDFEVKAGEWKYVGDLRGDELKAAGVGVAYPDEYDDEYSYYDYKGNELRPNLDRAFVPGTDPIPHYDRGRAYVPPKSA